MRLDIIREKKSESAKYMVDEITKVIKTFGKRGSGSEGEKKAVEYMAEQCQELGCEEVNVESFDVHPNAFMGWIYISISMLLISFGLYFVSLALALTWVKIVSLAIIVIGSAIMVGEFIMYKQVVDKLFPKKTSYNLTAVKNPSGEIQKRIFFNGHPDAAGEWTFNYLFGGVGFGIHFFVSIIGFFYLVALFIISFFVTNIPLMIKLGYGAFVFLPFWIALYILWNEKLIVDGANDNLTGCFMGIAILKALKENNIELEHTQIGVLITGSEEAGLRGAKAWCKAHKDEYKDVETLIVAYDTLHESEYLSVNEKDLNSTVKADPHVSGLFKNAADKLNITCGIGTVPLGATDSAAFNQNGFKATGITAMDHNLKDYYHTRKDSYDNLDVKTLEDTFAVSVQVVEDFEAE
jgi:hypothetical protein